MMFFFFALNDDIVRCILIEWLDLQDLVNLDNSLCNKLSREQFFSFLHPSLSDPSPLVIENGGVNLTVTFCRNQVSLKSVSNWFVKRNLRSKHVSIYDCLSINCFQDLIRNSFFLKSFSIEQTIKPLSSFVLKSCEFLQTLEADDNRPALSRLTLYLQNICKAATLFPFFIQLTSTIKNIEELHFDLVSFHSAADINILADTYALSLRKFTCQSMMKEAFETFFLHRHFIALEGFSMTKDIPYDYLNYIAEEKNQSPHINGGDMLLSIEQVFLSCRESRSLPHLKEIRCTDIYLVKLISYLGVSLKTMGMYFGGSSMLLYPQQLQRIIPSIGSNVGHSIQCLQLDFNEKSGLFRRNQGFAPNMSMLQSFSKVVDFALVTTDWSPYDKVIGELLLEIPQCFPCLKHLCIQLLFDYFSGNKSSLGTIVHSQLKRFYASLAKQQDLCLTSLKVENIPIFGNYLTGQTTIEENDLCSQDSDNAENYVCSSSSAGMVSSVRESLKTLSLLSPTYSIYFDDHLLPLRDFHQLQKLRVSYLSWRGVDLVKLTQHMSHLCVLRIDAPVFSSSSKVDNTWTFSTVHELIANTFSLSRLAIPLWHDFDLTHPEKVIAWLPRLQYLWLITSTHTDDDRHCWEEEWVRYLVQQSKQIVASKADEGHDAVDPFLRVFPVVSSALPANLIDVFEV